MQPNNLQSNIWKFAVILVSNKRIFAAFLGAYYLTIPDVTAQTIGFIFLMSNLAGFAFEIPSGYLSDKLGHKEALVLARIIMVVSTTLFLFADSVLFLTLGAVFMGISWSFMSGTGSAFMHETLRGLNRENEFTEIMGKIRSIGFAVPIILTVLAPFLIEISYKAPFALALVVDLVGLVVATALVKPAVTPEHIDEIGATNFKEVIRGGYKLGFFKYALFGAVLLSVIMSIGIFRAPYQLELGIPVIWFGVLFGLGRAGVSVILYFNGKIKNYFSGMLSFYRFEIILYFFLILILVATSNPWIVAGVFIVINAFQWGLHGVHNGYMMEVIKDSKFKATLLSTEAQLKNILSGFLTFFLGMYIENSSYQIAFMVIGAGMVLVLVPQYLYIKRNSKNYKN